MPGPPATSRAIPGVLEWPPPAASRLTAGSRPYPDTTHELCLYVFVYVFVALRLDYIYAFRHRFRIRSRGDRHDQNALRRRPGPVVLATPTTIPATARRKPACTSSRPTKARTICLRQPAGSTADVRGRRCKQARNTACGPGAKLPGGQYRKREQLADAHRVLRRIADGDVNARELPESVELLARDAAAPTALATVVHIPFGAVRAGAHPRTAA